MKTNKLFAMAGVVCILLILVSTSLMGQGNLNINTATVTGSGAIKVTGNVNNNYSGTATVEPLVILTRNTGGQTQYIQNNPVIFNNLWLQRASNKQASVNITVNNGLVIGDNDSTFGGTFTIPTDVTLAVADASTYQQGTLAFTTGTVNYTKSTGTQTLLNTAVTYGALGLSGNATKTVPASGTSSAATVSHADGAVTFLDDFNITTSGSFGTITDIATTKVVNFNITGASSITTVADVTGTLRKSGSEALSITTVSDNGGIIENTGTNSLSIGTLSTNTGTIRNTSTGSLAFTSTTNGTAGIITASDGSMSFANAVDNTGGTLSLSGDAEATFNAAFTAPGTLTFGGTSVVTYAGASYAIATPAGGYVNLVIGGSANKTAGAGFSITGDLTLTNSLTMTGALSLAEASDVSGSGEVIGSVQRSHAFTGAKDYTFNRADVLMAFAAGTGNITLTMTPGAAPENLGSLTKYASRRYDMTVTSNPGDVQKVQLYYATATEGTNVVDDQRLGIRMYNTTWNKIVDPAGYTRTVSSGVVTLSGLDGVSLDGMNELGMFQVTPKATVAGNWATPGTWDEISVPDNADDVEIAAAVTVASAAQAGSVDIQSGSLTMDGGDLTVTNAVTNAAALNLTNNNLSVASLTNSGSATVTVNNGRTLALTNALTNSSSSGLTFTGNLTAGSLSHTGSGTIALNGNSSTISGNVDSDGPITVNGTLTVSTAASTAFTGDGSVNVQSSGILTVGSGSQKNSMTIATLDVDASGQLQVYGDLAVGTSFTNDGIITVGE